MAGFPQLPFIQVMHPMDSHPSPMVLGSLSPVNKAYVDDIDSDGDNDLVYSASVGYYDRICVLENHGVMSKLEQYFDYRG